VEIRHGLTRRRGLTPVLLAGLVAAAAVGAFIVGRAASRPDRADAHVVAATAAASLSAHLEADARLLGSVAEAIGGDPSRPDDELLADLTRLSVPGRAMGVARATSTTAAMVAVTVPLNDRALARLDLGRDPVLRLALDLARDAGGPEVAAGPGADGRRTVIEAMPLFGTVDTPVDVGSRRQSLQGYIVMVAPDAAELGLAALSADADLAVRIVQGDTVLATAGRAAEKRAPESKASVPVTTNGASWTVEAWPTGAPSKAPIVEMLAGLLLAGLVGILAARRERFIKRAVFEAESRAQEVSLVARAGPLLQQSLAVSDVLPVFAVEISDQLGLNAVAIDLVAEDGRLARAFSLGPASSVHMTPAEVVTPSGRVPAGEVVSVPLLRGARSVGVLRARPVKGLSAPQVEALVAVCNLLAAALGNARLFQDEREMVERLRGVDRMKTRFVSSVSHELRTTVTAIEGFAGLLGSDSTSLDDPRRDDYLERLKRNARSLGVLVDDLLDFARFERATSELALKPVDLSHIVPQIVDQTSSLLADRPLSMHIAPGVTALADLSAVERILVNLLSNASKYTPSGSALEVILEPGDGVAVLTVVDHGPGIPEDERDNVFGLFYRVVDPSARATRGVGIGLALARQLIEKLGGEIGISETPGGGATFRVTIPLVNEPIAPAPSALTPAMDSS